MHYSPVWSDPIQIYKSYDLEDHPPNLECIQFHRQLEPRSTWECPRVAYDLLALRNPLCRATRTVTKTFADPANIFQLSVQLILAVSTSAPLGRLINTTAVSILQLVLLPKTNCHSNSSAEASRQTEIKPRQNLAINHKRRGFIPMTSTDALGMHESPDTPSWPHLDFGQDPLPSIQTLKSWAKSKH